MKSLTLFTFILAFLVSSQAAMRRGDLENSHYVKIGYSLPFWSSYGLTKTDWQEDLPYEGSELKRLGGNLSVGSIFIINSVDIANGFKIGINVDYLSLTYNHFRIDSGIFHNWFGNAYIESKVGPSLTYSPSENLYFDFYAKANIPWVASTFFEEKLPGATPDDEPIINDGVYLKYVGVRYSIGLNVRYSFLLGGFEFNAGSLKLQKHDDESLIFGNLDLDNDSEKTILPLINFHIGICF